MITDIAEPVVCVSRYSISLEALHQHPPLYQNSPDLRGDDGDARGSPVFKLSRPRKLTARQKDLGCQQLLKLVQGRPTLAPAKRDIAGCIAPSLARA
jgi:hypothetical protein